MAGMEPIERSWGAVSVSVGYDALSVGMDLGPMSLKLKAEGSFFKGTTTASTSLEWKDYTLVTAQHETAYQNGQVTQTDRVISPVWDSLKGLGSRGTEKPQPQVLP
jgi:hypothetical protein